MVTAIPAVRARQQFGGILKAVATHRHHVLITKAEMPLAVMISTAEYHEFLALKAAHGTIINLADMEPHDETSHCAVRPVRYALEVNRGWFAARAIKAGSRLSGFPAWK